MTFDRWMLPEGIEELLPEEAAKVERLRRKLLNQYASWGYQLVIPPLIEFVESLLLDTNPDLDISTYKMMDRKSGRTMGLRADITAQVARIDAHAMASNGVNRLCYAGSVVHTAPRRALGSRSPIQIGCELFGDDSVEADLEVISLMLNTLSSVGIPNITLDVGHVRIVRRILERVKISKDTEREILEALDSKRVEKLEGIIAKHQLSEETGQLLHSVATIQGGRDSFDRLANALRGFDDEIDAALSSVYRVLDEVELKYPNINAYVDFTETQGYDYHTGLVFSALTTEVGYPLANGGRYDDVSGLFGRARAATGFNADLKTLMTVAQLPEREPTKSIYVHREILADVWSEIEQLREDGNTVIEGNTAMPEDSLRRKCNFVLTFGDEGAKLRAFDENP